MLKAQVQMCFAPSDEVRFFAALRRGQFDAKAVSGAVDAMKATASVAADKAMITDRIKQELSMDSYNDQLRRFLADQYKLVAMRAASASPSRRLVRARSQGCGRCRAADRRSR